MHPTSVVHALVRLRDGALLAHLGLPDMRVPISYALSYPDRAPTPVPRLPLEGLELAFEAVDDHAFPLLGLARSAGERGGTAPCAYNAANEVAVAAFLEGRIAFLDIGVVVEETLSRVDGAARPRHRRSRRRGRRGTATRRAGGCSRHDHLHRDRRPRCADPHPRARPLRRVARPRHAPAEVLHRVPSGDREADDQRDRVRHRRDPARRLREDPRDAPPDARRRRHGPWARARRRRGPRRAGRSPSRCSGRGRPRRCARLDPRDARARRRDRASRRTLLRPCSAGSTISTTPWGRTPTGGLRRGSGSPRSPPAPQRTSCSRSCSSRASS